MPSMLHELLIELFRHRPALAPELLTDVLGLELPPFQLAQLHSEDASEVKPASFRADAVILLTAGERPVLAVVVEVQLRKDDDKRWTWPVYLATVRARLRCPAVLLVVCATVRTATWCSAPIDLGHPGWTLRPVVLGPDAVPEVTDPVAALQDPELAVLSALAHPDRPPVLQAMATVLSTVKDDSEILYYDMVAAHLPAAARRYLEALMTRTYEYQSDFARKYYFEGVAGGQARSVLDVLHARGIEVSDADRERIVECTDREQLAVWLSRAANAHSIDEVLA